MSLTIEYFEIGLMQNLVYLLRDVPSNRAALVDPAWNVPEIVSRVEQSGARLTDVLITHCHDDHTNALTALLKRYPDVVVHYAQSEAPIWTDRPRARAHPDNALIELGETRIELLHTPGHSPGSACYHVNDALFTGDTLFVYGCGRCDLPWGDASQMFDSLQRLVNELPAQTVIYPGHHYAEPVTSTLEEQLRGNPFLHIRDRDEFIGFRRIHSDYRQPPYQPVLPGQPAW